MQSPFIFIAFAVCFVVDRSAGRSRLYFVEDMPSVANRLYEKLFQSSNYSSLLRPKNSVSSALLIKMGLKLSQILDVDEKNQIMTTNVWLRQEWYDESLRWDPTEFSGVRELFIPPEKIWLPDVVLYNNADGNYQVTLMTKVALAHNGHIVWEPPVIYKSSCLIDVEYFPYDQQECQMKFGLWTYDGLEVDLRLIQDPGNGTEAIGFLQEAIDTSSYYKSAEWDLLAVPAQRHVVNREFYLNGTESYIDITYSITIRRKTLFYTINLIIPCVAISFLTVLVFYLPSDSNEKVTLCVSILLSLTVFFLLLAETVPPTSLVMPLIGKYLVFTMFLVTLSIVLTIVVLNVHLRSPEIHTMSTWIQVVFTVMLPKILQLTRPPQAKEDFESEDEIDRDLENLSQMLKPAFDYPPLFSSKKKAMVVEVVGSEKNKPNYRATATGDNILMSGLSNSERLFQSSSYHSDVTDSAADTCSFGEMFCSYPQIRHAVADIEAIATHFKRLRQYTKLKEEWKYVAMVLDRLLLYIFSLSCLLGFFGIILQAPTIYDDPKTIDRDELVM